MTTTLKPAGQVVGARPLVPVEEHPDLQTLPRWPEAPAAGEPKARSRRWMVVAIGVVAALVGLIVGFGIAWWMRSDEVARLETKATVMNSVPYGGFKALYSAPREHVAQTPAGQLPSLYGTAYSAPREHQALADTLAAGGAQGSWQTASNGTRTFLYYPTT